MIPCVSLAYQLHTPYPHISSQSSQHFLARPFFFPASLHPQKHRLPHSHALLTHLYLYQYLRTLTPPKRNATSVLQCAATSGTCHTGSITRTSRALDRRSPSCGHVRTDGLSVKNMLEGIYVTSGYVLNGRRRESVGRVNNV